MVVGRDVEWDRCAQVIDRLRDGPVCVFVEGDAGIGKTTLLDAVAAQAHQQGIRVLRCRPTQSEVRLTHGGLVELLDGLALDAVARLPDPQQRAIRLALRWDEPDGRALDRQAVAAAVSGVLRAKALEGPLLLAVDDLHWLDNSTGNALEYALRRMSGMPVGLIGAARTHEGDRPRPTERAFPPERVERHTLGPLEPSAIRTLIADRLGWQLTPRDAKRIADAARGNPFVALEIARTVQPTGMPPHGQRLPVPDDVRQMIVRRLEGLPAVTRDALVESAAGAAPTAPPINAAALGQAERAGIVRVLPDGRVVFVHPLFEAAVYEATPLAERQEVHARLAGVAPTPEQRARHLALAASGPDVAIAGALEHAAEVAAARGDSSTAAELAEIAWRSTPAGGGPAGPPRALAAARFALSAGMPADAIRILEEALPSLAGTARGHALLCWAEATVWARPIGEAVPIFEAALADLDDDAAGATAAYLGLCFSLFQSGAPPDIFLDQANRAVHRAESSDPGALAEALAVRAMSGWLVGEGVDHAALERAAALHDTTRATPAHYRPDGIRATILGYSDQIEVALEWFVEQLESCVATGRVGDVLYLGMHGTTFAMWAGQPRLARRVIELTTQAAQDIGGAFALISGGALNDLYRLTLNGDLDEVRAAARAGLALGVSTGSVHANIWLSAVAAQTELAAGHPDAALEWVRPGIEAPVGARLPDPAALFVILEAIEALIGVGDIDRARSVLDPYEAASVALGRRWCQAASLRCRALLAAAGGEVDVGVEYAQQAVGITADLGYVIEHARNNLVLGQLLRRQRRRAAAREALETALALFEQTELKLWIQRARDELSRAWPRRTGGELTTAEARIAELVASGMTNGEIATTVFVSRRTVEATLSRVYRKLGVRNRAELTGRLRPGSGDDDA